MEDPTDPAIQRDRVYYSPHPRSVRLARHRTAALVADWGYPQLAGNAALLVSELAANAVVHGNARGRVFAVEVMLTKKTLRIAVADTKGEQEPVPRAAGPEDKGGRGLLIVDVLAASWGVRPQGSGKEVWAQLPLPGEPPPPKNP